MCLWRSFSADATHPWQSAEKDRYESEESARKVPAHSRQAPPRARRVHRQDLSGLCLDFCGPFQVPAVPAQVPPEPGSPGTERVVPLVLGAPGAGALLGLSPTSGALYFLLPASP